MQSWVGKAYKTVPHHHLTYTYLKIKFQPHINFVTQNSFLCSTQELLLWWELYHLHSRRKMTKLQLKVQLQKPWYGKRKSLGWGHTNYDIQIVVVFLNITTKFFNNNLGLLKQFSWQFWGHICLILSTVWDYFVFHFMWSF